MPHPFARYRPLIDDWTAFAEALERPLPTCVWANPLKTNPEALAARLEAEGAMPKPVGWLEGAFTLPGETSPGRLLPFRAGHCHVQEEASLVPVALLDPQPGERIFDACAAPGGKTAQMAARMQNRGTIVANDRDGMRLRAVGGTLDRLGIANVSTTRYDATGYPEAAGTFDRVLADVPCSCEGTSRKHPGVLNEAARAETFPLASVQQAILQRALDLCRPGGRVVYATCTYAPEENEAVVDAVLRTRDDAALRPARLPRLACSEGITQWRCQRFDASLRHALRLWPHQNDSGGFFVVVLEKAGDAPRTPTPLVEEDADRTARLEPLCERFGFPPALFDDYVLTRPSRKKCYLAARGHAPPARPQPEATGMAFLRVNMHFPKLTTAAAMLFGAHATRNAVPLDAAQRDAFLGRDELRLTPAQADYCTGTGYVLPRHDGLTLGVGLYRTEARVLESLHPKKWSDG